MTQGPGHKPDGTADDSLEKAVEWFLRVRSEGASTEDLLELQPWLEGDPLNALAYRKVSETWSALGTHASAPEIIVGRRNALEDSRLAVRRRWSAPMPLRWHWAAAALLLLVVAGLWWGIGQQVGVYATARGGRRSVTLDDGSILTLDAQSRVRVRYSEGERRVRLEEGQARFAVAKDPLRPFRVQAREQTVVALGTQFDVELVTDAVLVTLIEGHVAVAGVDAQSLSEAGSNVHGEPGEAASSSAAANRQNRHSDQPAEENKSSGRMVELQAGQGLRVRGDGAATLLINVNVDHATAWQSGKVFFDDEPLADAVMRINRYARRTIAVDPSVAKLRISGVFNSGDTDAFVEGVTSYLPVRIGSSGNDRVQLTARR